MVSNVDGMVRLRSNLQMRIFQRHSPLLVFSNSPKVLLPNGQRPSGLSITVCCAFPKFNLSVIVLNKSLMKIILKSQCVFNPAIQAA